MIHEGDIIDVSTAARLLGLHEETLRRMARGGHLPAFKVGRGWRFNRTTLHEIRKVYAFIPVIVITGYPDSDLVARVLEHGPIALPSTPVEPKRLLSVIRMATNGGVADDPLLAGDEG